MTEPATDTTTKDTPMSAVSTPKSAAAVIEAARAAAAAQAARRVAPANTTTTPTKPRRMSLANVVSGKVTKPLRVVMHGLEGVGKSTFAANAPAPIFIGAEDGTSELDVHRFPQPHAWPDVFDAVAELTRADHQYQTLVIDTLDWLEPKCWAYVCETHRDTDGKPYKDIEAFGFGKGYQAALDEWRRLAGALEHLSEKRGMHVILLAHSWVRSFKDPTVEPFDRYEMKLQVKASALWREWAYAVLFAAHDLSTTEKRGRVRGIMGRARYAHCERTAAYDAKNRYDLPARIPLDWHEFYAGVEAHRPATDAKLIADIESLLALTPDPKRVARVRASLDAAVAAGNSAELGRIANKLAALITAEAEQAEPAAAADSGATPTDTTQQEGQST